MKFKTEDFEKVCGCRSAGECTHNLGAPLEALEACVDLFAEGMKQKLKKQLYGKGFSGWDDPDWPIGSVIARLIEHVGKGDMVDVANLAMFAWNKEEPVKYQNSLDLFNKFPTVINAGVRYLLTVRCYGTEWSICYEYEAFQERFKEKAARGATFAEAVLEMDRLLREDPAFSCVSDIYAGFTAK